MNGDRHVINEELKALLSDPVRLFMTNREAMKKAFAWQGALMHCLCALLAANRAALIDTERVSDMRRLVRERAGVFSPFRGLPALPLSTLLSQSLMPESDFGRVEKLYKTLRQAGFVASPYLAEAALQTLLSEPFDGESCAKRARDMFERQRKSRPFLDAQTACMYTLLAAASGQEAEPCHIETELGYQLLKTSFPATGTTYALARVLTIGEGETEQKCDRAIRLYQALRDRELRYGRLYELPALGVLSLLPVPIDELADGVAAMDARLRAEKGFSVWTIPTSQRILYALSLYAVTLVNERQSDWLTQGLIQSVTGVLIAAQTAACVAAASSASAAASSSGGN